MRKKGLLSVGDYEGASFMRRFGHLLAAITLISLLLCMMHTSALASFDKTADDAVNWVVKQHTEGVGYEYDGYTGEYVDGSWVYIGPQCVDLIVGYMDYISGTHTRGNGKDYATNYLPSGYSRTEKGIPQKGDILVWTTGQFGHVAIVTSVKSDGKVVYSEQNGSLSLRVSHNREMYPSKSDYWGIIRPDFRPVTGGLDVNGYLDSNSNAGNIEGYGTFDIYINGALAGDDVTDYYRTYLSGWTSYEIKDIKATTGHSYVGVSDGSLKGTITSGTVTDVRLRFNTNTYAIGFNSNTNETVSGMPGEQTKTYGKDLILPTNIPTREHYEFIGWSASPTATIASYQPGGTYSANANATLYAVWKQKTYTITFDPNGGQLSATKKAIPYGSAYGTLPVPSRVGYTFDGWYTSAEGGSPVSASTILTEHADQTVYAHWSPMGELVLPGAIQTIDEEAFKGDSHISHVVVPASCMSIESQAFANCANLISVRILGKNTIFESDTFAGSPNVVIYCYSGSRAQRLASADGLEYHLIGVASDWVLADAVPQGAEITDRKWTYTLREYAENAAATYAGWTKYDEKRTSWTGWSAWQNTEVASSTDREVKKQQVISGYKMISYCVSGPNGRSYQPSLTYSLRLTHGPYEWSKAELDSARVFPAGSFFDYASNVSGYVLDGTAYCKWDGSETGGYVPMFIQETIYATQWSYRDAVYTYYYYRDLSKESATDPTGQEEVTNVQEWVKYIY